MFKFLIITAFVIRLILMPISAHSDLFFINYYPNHLLTGGLGSTVESNVSYYPPLTLYVLAFFQNFYHFFSGTFSSWMGELYRLSNSGLQGQADTYIEQAPNTSLYKDIFLAKFPYLLFDLATVIVIYEFVKKKALSKSAILLWLFNPVLIYSIYIFGQFEIIPTFFVFLGFFLLKKNVKLSLLTLGVAAAFKNYAFLFILPTAIIYGNNWSERLKLILIAIVPYILFLLPTIIVDAQGAIYALFPKVYLHYRKPLDGWPLYSQLIKYFLLSASYIGVLFLSLLIKTKDKWRTSLGISLVSVLLVLAIAPRISFHYLLWAIPLVILWFRNTKVALILVVVQTISLASYKLLAIHLQIGLFAPLNPNLSQSPTINSVINQFVPYGIISSVGFFIFLLFNISIAGKIILDLLFKETTASRQV